MSDRQTFVAILAGGSGTRLWPLSRSSRPKQLLSLVNDRSLLQNTFDRITPLVPPERILVMTERSHAEAVVDQLPELPPGNIFVEPARRGTAGSLALAASAIERRDPNALMASVHSDAFIDDSEEFRQTLGVAFAAADELRHLILAGIEPSFPSTQLGYIEGGELLKQDGAYSIRKAVRFVEKPELERARRFLASGRHFWNPGVFVWRIDIVLEEFDRLQPAIRDRIAEIANFIGSPRQSEVLNELYPTLPEETIDVGILEKSSRVAVIPARFRWNDIGSWGELLDILPRDAAGNVVRGAHLGLGTRDSLIFATSRPVTTVGLKDMIVVETPDAVLVCPRQRVQDVKKLVERLALDPDLRHLL